jgi:hypothetical protein
MEVRMVAEHLEIDTTHSKPGSTIFVVAKNLLFTDPTVVLAGGSRVLVGRKIPVAINVLKELSGDNWV